MGQLFRYLFVGTIAFIPLFIVVQVVLWINNTTIELFYSITKYTNNQYYSLGVILITILFLILIGWTTEKFGKSIVVSVIERILNKIPAIGTIYSIVKKVVNMFASTNKDDKKEVVLVEYPKKDLWVPAYVLSGYEDTLVLFIPTSPNPTSGYTVIVKKDIVKSTTLSVAEASQFIVSMGADFIKKEEISAIISKNQQTKENI